MEINYMMDSVEKSGAQHSKGFTLIELSIVLVIIGLIVGGILVGQDLIKSAEIRATIAQIEKYNTAVNNFRNKYNGMPGDLATTTASSFGLFSTLSGGTGYGDGNGMIEGGASTNTSAGVAGVGETLAFWVHLSQTNMVDGSFGSTLPANGALSTACSSSISCNAYMPLAKMGRGNLIIANAVSGINYFGIVGVSTIAATTGAYSGSNTMTPQEAYNIDKKTDDGLPNSGIVNAIDATSIPLTYYNGASTNAGCVIGTSYNLSGTFGTTQNCALRIKFNAG